MESPLVGRIGRPRVNLVEVLAQAESYEGGSPEPAPGTRDDSARRGQSSAHR
jgi:hypothetical protein